MLSLIRDFFIGLFHKKEPPPKESIVLDPDGFHIASTLNDQIIATVHWTDVSEIVTWKNDLLTTDEICLSFRISIDPDKYVWISEETPGFIEASEEMGKRFPSIPNYWYSSAMQRPVDRNETVLYSKTSEQVAEPDREHVAQGGE